MARKQKVKFYFTYKTTNLINEKYYFGMHVTTNLNDGYLGSGKRIRRSINKYGKENFKLEILEFFENIDELKNGEILLITEKEIKDPNCMNLQLGGGGGFSVEQQKINAKNSNKKQKLLFETDPIFREKKIKANKKFNVAGLNAIKEQGITWKTTYSWLGKTHTDETKEKIGQKSSEHQIGKGNSQYGTCWIHNLDLKESKKIKKEELQKYLLLNWLKGRKIKF